MTGNQFLCIDCGEDTGRDGLNEYYMVHDAVWVAAGLGPHDGMLCIGCLEARIGRQLRDEDFRVCFINCLPGSPRLMARLWPQEGRPKSGLVPTFRRSAS